MSFRIPSSLRHISQLVSGGLIARVLGIVVLMLYVRMLSKEEMAVIPICRMLAGLSLLPFSFGIYPTLVKRLPQLFRDRPQMARRLLFSSALITIGGTVLASITVLVFRHNIAGIIFDDHNHEQLIAWMSLGFIPLAISRIADNVLWAKGRFGNMASLQVIQAIVSPGLTLPLFFAFGLTGLVLGFGLSQLTHALLALFCVRDVLVGGFPSMYPLRRLVRESFPFYMEGYLMYFRREGDSWCVSTMLGPANLAVYYIAKKLYSTFFALHTSIDRVVVERFARVRKNRWRLTSLVQTTHDAISHVMVPCVLLAISLLPSLVWIFGGGRYKAATLPAAILLIAVMISFLRMPMQRAVFVALPSSYRFYMVLLESIFLFLTLFAFGPLYGVAGIAAARVVGQLSGGVFGFTVLVKKMNCRVKFNSTVMSLLISCAPTALILCLQLQIDTLMQGVTCAAIVTLVWLAAFLALTYLVNRVAVTQLIHLCRKDAA